MKVRLAWLLAILFACVVATVYSLVSSFAAPNSRSRRSTGPAPVAVADSWPEPKVDFQPPEHRESDLNCPTMKAGKPVRESVEQDPARQTGYRLIVDLSDQVLKFEVPREETFRDSRSQLDPEDTLAVTASRARLMSRDREVARVPRGTLLHAAWFRQPWIGTAVIQNGVRKVGWIHEDDVRFYSAEPNLNPVPTTVCNPQFASAGMLVLKAKVFDDGLYAAVEIAAQKGLGDFAGRELLLKSLAGHLGQETPASFGLAEQIVVAGAKLGNAEVSLSPPLLRDLDSRIETFLADSLRSKPMGFYPWSDELTNIFRQNRMLQTSLLSERPSESELASLGRLVKALHADPKARAVYAANLELISRLTNPLAGPDLRGLLKAADEGADIDPPADVAFFPPSRSRETELMKRLYGTDRPIPRGFNLMDELIARIQDGRLDLAPTEDSGWYDYQTWALEPMVAPERMPEWKHAQMDEEYRKKLIELFKGAYALTRETHIVQAESPDCAAEAPMPHYEIEVPLEISGEPLPTYYLRRAESYAFLRTVLEETFGPEALKQMHRLTPDGPVDKTLDEELRWMESLFRGAYTTVGRQLGMAVPSGSQDSGGGEPEADARLFLNWTANLALDPDLNRDVRMMVPVFYDLGRRKMKVWAMLGWQTFGLWISYVDPPQVQVLDLDGNVLPESRYDLSFEDRQYKEVVIPITAEFYVDRLLNREEFRKVVDTYRTKSAVLQNVAAEE